MAWQNACVYNKYMYRCDRLENINHVITISHQWNHQHSLFRALRVPFCDLHELLSFLLIPALSVTRYWHRLCCGKRAIKLNPLMRGWVTVWSECANTCWLFPWELSRGTEPRATVLEFSPRTKRVTSIQLSAILPPSLLSVTNRLPEQTPTVSTVQGLGLCERHLNPQGSFYLCLNLWRVSSWLSYINTYGNQWTSNNNKDYFMKFQSCIIVGSHLEGWAKAMKWSPCFSYCRCNIMHDFRINEKQFQVFIYCVYFCSCLFFCQFYS